MTYPNVTDEEIRKLRDAIDYTLGSMKSDIRKKKLKVFGRTILSLAIVTGGIALAIVYSHRLSLSLLSEELPR